MTLSCRSFLTPWTFPQLRSLYLQRNLNSSRQTSSLHSATLQRSRQPIFPILRRTKPNHLRNNSNHYRKMSYAHFSHPHNLPPRHKHRPTKTPPSPFPNQSNCVQSPPRPQLTSKLHRPLNLGLHNSPRTAPTTFERHSLPARHAQKIARHSPVRNHRPISTTTQSHRSTRRSEPRDPGCDRLAPGRARASRTTTMAVSPPAPVQQP